MGNAFFGALPLVAHFFVGGKFMVYEKTVLQSTSLLCLREIGKKIGVRAPTSLKKDVLIENIIDIQEHRVAPYFSNFGRKRLLTNTKDLNIEEFYKISLTKKEVDKLFEEVVDQFLAKLKVKILDLYYKK